MPAGAVQSSSTVLTLTDWLAWTPASVRGETALLKQRGPTKDAKYSQ